MTLIRDENNVRDDVFKIRVFGKPQAFPKKILGRNKRTGKSMFLDRDYRTRKNPITGKTEKYDHGYKAQWVETVQFTVLLFMEERDIPPFRKNHPIAMGCLFYLPKAKSCKLPYPSQDPDEDNLDYAIKNALKRTPKKRGMTGRYPYGVLYYDDNQIIWRLHPSGKLWASDANPPGVLITVVDALKIKPEIDPYTENLNLLVVQ